MQKEQKIKIGDIVTISNNLLGSKTHAKFGLDSKGVMLSMQGEPFQVAGVSSQFLSDLNDYNILCTKNNRQYRFSIDDVSPLSAQKKQSFLFDEKLLDL